MVINLKINPKILVIANVCLALSAVFLLLTFLGVKLPTVGQAIYLLDQEQAYCVVSYQGHTALLDLERCCSELQQQLFKSKSINQQFQFGEEKVKTNRKYYTGPSTIEYFINQKAYWYCKNNGYVVN